MPARRVSKTEMNSTPLPPATTPQGRENQLVSLAFDLVEKRMREGTASAQETTHFLKLGSSREVLEQERLANENLLTQAKVKELEERASIEALYRKALGAMSEYQGRDAPEESVELED